jgi:hypothetical protein
MQLLFVESNSLKRPHVSHKFGFAAVQLIQPVTKHGSHT